MPRRQRNPQRRQSTATPPLFLIIDQPRFGQTTLDSTTKLGRLHFLQLQLGLFPIVCQTFYGGCRAGFDQ